MSPPPTGGNVVAFLGANVRRLRLRSGRTQERFAEDAGISVVHLRRVERGVADVRISMLAALASALDVPIGRLLAPAVTQERPAGRPPRARPRRG